MWGAHLPPQGTSTVPFIGYEYERSLIGTIEAGATLFGVPVALFWTWRYARVSWFVKRHARVRYPDDQLATFCQKFQLPIATYKDPSHLRWQPEAIKAGFWGTYAFLAIAWSRMRAAARTATISPSAGQDSSALGPRGSKLYTIQHTPGVWCMLYVHRGWRLYVRLYVYVVYVVYVVCRNDPPGVCFRCMSLAGRPSTDFANSVLRNHAAHISSQRASSMKFRRSLVVVTIIDEFSSEPRRRHDQPSATAS